MPGVMRDLAERILPVYQENDVERYLANLSALQLTSGNYAAAYATQQSLRERRQQVYPNKLSGRELVSDIYVRARANEAQNHVSFAQAFTQSFQDLALRLDNPDTFTLIKRLRTPVAVLQADLQKALDARRALDARVHPGVDVGQPRHDAACPKDRLSAREIPGQGLLNGQSYSS